jgi:hypothetical protein
MGKEMVNRPKSNGTAAESMVVEYLRDNGWPYAKRLSLSGAKDIGDIDLHPNLVLEVKATQGRLKVGPWMDETDAETLRAQADYGLLVMKYAGVASRNVGKFLTCMRWHEAKALFSQANFPPERLWQTEYGVIQRPVEYLKSADRLATKCSGEMSAVVHQARGQEPFDYYHFMWLEDRIRLFKDAGYGEIRTGGKREPGQRAGW